MLEVEPMRRDESRRPYAPKTVTARDLTRLAWQAVLLIVLAEGLLFVLGGRVPLAVVVLIPISVLVARRLVKAAKPPPTLPPMQRAPADPRPADRPFRDVGRMEDRLAWGGQDMAHFDAALRPVLARLADDRLYQRHGITRTSHPEQARQLLGDKLWQLMTGPGVASKAAGPSPAELRPFVESLERL